MLNDIQYPTFSTINSDNSEEDFATQYSNYSFLSPNYILFSKICDFRFTNYRISSSPNPFPKLEIQGAGLLFPMSHLWSVSLDRNARDQIDYLDQNPEWLQQILKAGSIQWNICLTDPLKYKAQQLFGSKAIYWLEEDSEEQSFGEGDQEDTGDKDDQWMHRVKQITIGRKLQQNYICLNYLFI